MHFFAGRRIHKWSGSCISSFQRRLDSPSTLFDVSDVVFASLLTPISLLGPFLAFSAVSVLNKMSDFDCCSKQTKRAAVFYILVTFPLFTTLQLNEFVCTGIERGYCVTGLFFFRFFWSRASLFSALARLLFCYGQLAVNAILIYSINGSRFFVIGMRM